MIRYDFEAVVTIATDDIAETGDEATGFIVIDIDGESEFSLNLNGQSWYWDTGQLVTSVDSVRYDSCTARLELCEYIIAPQGAWRVDVDVHSLGYFNESYVRLIADWPKSGASLEFTSIQPSDFDMSGVPEPASSVLVVIACFVALLWRNFRR